MKSPAAFAAVMIWSAFLLAPCTAWSSPCDDVDRTLTEQRKIMLSEGIISQLHAQRLDVLQSFQLGGWTILYVDPHNADEEFLFYKDDPLNSLPVTTWAGAATKHEQERIREWTLKNAPGIPSKLANCFAWHVTKDRSGWPPL
jgi:hypothetical protein